jgi:hypothetical protein
MVSASTDTQRRPAMLSLDEAVERLLGQVRPPGRGAPETGSRAFDALGRVSSRT